MESSAVDYFKVGDAQEGLPFAIYPSALFYQAGAFQEIGINEPPHKYGDQYVAIGPAAAALNVSDGTAVPWDYDTARTIAMLLTVDTNNNDATQAGFDPDQHRAVRLRATARRPARLGRLLGRRIARGRRRHRPDSRRLVDRLEVVLQRHVDRPLHRGRPALQRPDVVEPGWRPVLQWQGRHGGELPVVHVLHDAVPATTGTWLPSRRTTEPKRPLSTPTPSASGRTRKNPDAAFTVLQYLLGPAAQELTTVYGAMPAKEDLRQAFFNQLEDSFGTLQNPTDWQVFLDGIDHADMPNFESPLPFNKSGENTYNESLSAINTYATRWDTTQGLDMDAQITQMQADLQAIWDK